MEMIEDPEDNSMDTVYLVIAYRYGRSTNEGHDFSFPLGVYASPADARAAGAAYTAYRGGKYDCRVFPMEIRYDDDDFNDYYCGMKFPDFVGS